MNESYFEEFIYAGNAWEKTENLNVFSKDVELVISFQDDNNEGISELQKESFRTYQKHYNRFVKDVPSLIIDYYKWYFEEIDKVVNLPEDYQKDTICEAPLYVIIRLVRLCVCRDGSFGWVFRTLWDDDGIAVLLSGERLCVIHPKQLSNLHKLIDPTIGLLIHDGELAWKGLEQHHFYGELENLEIKLEGGVEEDITPQQQKAYATYQQNKEQYFRDLSRLMLSVYVGGEKKADEMLQLGQQINVKTILPKTLYIDRDGNFGWTCYTDWNKSYVDVLLSSDNPYFMEKGDLKLLSDEGTFIDKEMGVFFDDYLGLRSTVVVRLAGEVRTLPFTIDIMGEEKSIGDNMRDAFKKYVEFNKTLWGEIQDMTLSYYKSNYSEFEANYNFPESLQKDKVNRDSVMSLLTFTKLYMTSEGRIAWLCEFPIAADGLAFEFTDGFVDLISQPEII